MKNLKLFFFAFMTVILSMVLVSCGGDDDSDSSSNSNGYGRFDNLMFMGSTGYRNFGDNATFTFNKNGTYSSTDIPFLGAGTWKINTDEKFKDLFCDDFNDSETDYLYFNGSGYEYDVICQKGNGTKNFLFYPHQQYGYWVFTINCFY